MDSRSKAVSMSEQAYGIGRSSGCDALVTFGRDWPGHGCSAEVGWHPFGMQHAILTVNRWLRCAYHLANG
jgi:hypothetical protein